MLINFATHEDDVKKFAALKKTLAFGRWSWWRRVSDDAWLRTCYESDTDRIESWEVICKIHHPEAADGGKIQLAMIHMDPFRVGELARMLGSLRMISEETYKREYAIYEEDAQFEKVKWQNRDAELCTALMEYAQKKPLPQDVCCFTDAEAEALIRTAAKPAGLCEEMAWFIKPEDLPASSPVTLESCPKRAEEYHEMAKKICRTFHMENAEDIDSEVQIAVYDGTPGVCVSVGAMELFSSFVDPIIENDFKIMIELGQVDKDMLETPDGKIGIMYARQYRHLLVQWWERLCRFRDQIHPEYKAVPLLEMTEDEEEVAFMGIFIPAETVTEDSLMTAYRFLFSG